MATLIDWNTLKTKVQLYKSLYDCESETIALAYIVLENTLGLLPDDIRDSITDGSHDRGIDAIYIDDRTDKVTIHLFQFKYKEKFEAAKNNFPSSEVDKLLSFISDLLSKDTNLKNTCNPILWSKVREIWSVFDDARTPSFVVHFVGNMEALNSTENKRLKSSLAPYRYFEVRHHTLQSIVSNILEKKVRRVNGQLQLVDKQYFERVDGNIRGLIATIQATELINLIRHPDNQNEVSLDVFNDNVRIYLTEKNPINQKIIRSALSDNNAEFWYLNNGITITCDSLEYPPGTRAPILKMENLQIVNGGQTSHALFESGLREPERIEDVLVLIKVYETKQKEISQKIAESTNSQTPIKSRDLHSNDDVQKKLAEEFTDLGYFYERKTNQHKEEEKSKRIDAMSAGAAYLAYILNFPEVAKKDKGRIYGDLYELVFNEDITSQGLLTPLQVFEPIEKQKRTVQSSIRRNRPINAKLLFMIEGAYHVLYTVSVLCNLNGVDKSDSSIAKNYIKDAITIVGDAVAQEIKKDEAFTYGRFFKDSETKQKISRVAQKYMKRRKTR